MTYNHAAYINDAFNGFCMQETSFPFVCTIFDDDSTDGEQEVIKNYLNDHFDLENEAVLRYEETDDYTLMFAQHKTNKNCYFAIFFLKYNHYRLKKTRRPYFEGREIGNSKYIAICEGDDYWIHPRKLQMQVDFLENNPEYGLVHTKSKEYYETTQRYVDSLKGKRTDTFDEFIEANTIVTATSLFLTQINKDFFEDIPKSRKWPAIDLAKWLYIYLHSKVGFIDETTAVYRVLDESASHSKSIEKTLSFYNTSAMICQYFIEQSGRKYLMKKFKKKYFRLITHLYYLSRKRVKWESIAPYICFDLKSFSYIIASFILPKHE